MGLLKASLIFIIGNFTISLMKEDYIKRIDDVPIIGNLFGKDIQKLIIKNKSMALLIILTLVELIL
jgi:hypothetical protein